MTEVIAEIKREIIKEFVYSLELLQTKMQNERTIPAAIDEVQFLIDRYTAILKKN